MDYFASLLRLPDVRSRPLFNPFSLGDWSLATSPFTLLVIISKLAIQQPKDISIRLLLLPPGLYLCTYAVTFRDYALGGPQYNPWNYGVGLTSFALAMKMVHMSFTRTVPDRIVQFPSIPRKGPITVGEGCRTNGGDFSTAEGLKTEPLKGTLQDIIAYIFDPRCLRYDYKMAKTFRAIETRNTSNRVSFIISTVCRFILHLCLFDLFQTILQILPLPGLGTPKGGSIYNNTFPSPVRYIVSTTAVLSTGAAVYAGLEIGHNIVTLIGVGLLQLDPADHPPIFSRPWVSTSLRDLWSRRWHSLFRNYFAVLGYAVGHRIMGEVGGVLGVFLLSGLLHDWTIWGMGKGTDFWRIVGFFYLQGIGMCIEATFSVVTGRKVRGWWGRAWTWLFMLTTAHLVVEAWLQRGLAGGTFFLKHEYRPVLNFYQCFIGRRCM